MLAMRTCPVLTPWIMSQSLFLPLAFVWTTIFSRVDGDPANLVLNGDFETQDFVFTTESHIDAMQDAFMDFIPYWRVLYGGVQVLDGTVYAADANYGGGYVIHMNGIDGRGVLVSSPVVTPRKGATYNLTFDIADNPDGGPLYKTVKVKILVNDEEADPIIEPYSVSSPESEQSTISWNRMGVVFVGTGESTTIQFESMTSGSCGALIDNVQVSLLSLIDNGSFENTNSLLVVTNDSWYNVIQTPSDIITSWTVVNGSIKRAGSYRWQPSSDATLFALDLNADDQAGTILSDPFPTVLGSQYVVLYDAAASPEDIPQLQGDIFGCVKSSATGGMLAYATVSVNAYSFSADNIGWITYRIAFEASGPSAVVEFVSKVTGSDGPILDNVLAYQVVPTAKYTSVPLSYSTTAAATSPRPSMWITEMLAAGGVMIVIVTRRNR